MLIFTKLLKVIIFALRDIYTEVLLKPELVGPPWSSIRKFCKQDTLGICHFKHACEICAPFYTNAEFVFRFALEHVVECGFCDIFAQGLNHASIKLADKKVFSQIKLQKRVKFYCVSDGIKS